MEVKLTPDQEAFFRKAVAEQQCQLAEIEEGLRDAEAGRVVPHAKVERWLKSWGKKPRIP
jgi:predicted transcriptional regulator